MTNIIALITVFVLTACMASANENSLGMDLMNPEGVLVKIPMPEVKEDVRIFAVVAGNKTSYNATSIFIKNMGPKAELATIAVPMGRTDNVFAQNLTINPDGVCWVDIPFKITPGQVKLYAGHIANQFQ